MSRPLRNALSYTLVGSLSLAGSAGSLALLGATSFGGCTSPRLESQDEAKASQPERVARAVELPAAGGAPAGTTSPVTASPPPPADPSPNAGEPGRLTVIGDAKGGAVTFDASAGKDIGGGGGLLVETKPGAAMAIVKGHQTVGPRRASIDEPGSNTESYQRHEPNEMIATAEDALSTFSVDVDTASYSIVRRKILDGQPVPPAAVRVEEMLNYFRYAYAAPTDDRAFAVHLEGAPSPFTEGRHLVRVGIKGRELAKSQRKRAHLTFLVDVSGSMRSPDKLPLAKRALRILVDNLNDGDTVALVTYAGSTRVVLGATELDKKAEIHAAIDRLDAAGSTAMASGLELAYREAQKTLERGAVSRVIVLTDGDTNVGTTSWQEILKSIEGYRREGITLSTIGFGMGNYKDTLMEQLADKGDGNYYYIDGLSEAKKVFQEQLGGTLEVIAQDVKLQVEMNPKTVKRYRLIGYENRDIADHDFRNDAVDAGEIGAGHSVTALYEVELHPGVRIDDELATVRIRAKKPGGREASESAYPMTAASLARAFDEASESFRFAVAVMAVAEKLRKSPYAQEWSFAKIVEIARRATPDGNDERREFLSLITEKVELAAR